ncbi:MAG: ATP-binding protein [Acutalibacteraceae bacterium]|nr:ATP-binding protein [Acutalibacteraceae bacterium]
MLNKCDSLLKQTTQSLTKFDTGNGIVDAILTEKQEKATTVNTVITFNGAIAASAITATDLSVIFGNTLDNAIEACEKLQADIKKEVSVVCKYNSGFMFLTISNPVTENIKIHNNTIQTTKQDKSNHGFGLYSLQKIVDKYDGTLTFSCDDNVFECEVTLNV